MSSKAPATKARPSYSSVAQSTVSAAAPAAPATVAAPSPASAPAVAPITGAQQISQYLQSLSNREQNGHRKAIHTLLGNFAGKQVTVEFNDGNIVKGIWHTSSAFYEKVTSNDIVLKAAELIQSGATPKDFSPGNTLVFEYSSVVSVTASVAENARAAALREFKTDSATKRKDISHLDGRDLEGLGMDWLTPSTNMALESSNDNREWNQFAANEQLFGVKSSYDENIYTKPLDKGTISADRLARAEKLAALIEGDSSDNIHLREERGQTNERDLSEEALYSGVIRDDYQGANNTKEKWESGSAAGPWKRPAPKPVTNAWERKPKIFAQGDNSSNNNAPPAQVAAPASSTGGRGAGKGGRGEGRGDGNNREGNTRERRNPANAATNNEANQNKGQLGIDTSVPAAGANSVASPPPGLLPTPPKPVKGDHNKNAQNVASDHNKAINNSNNSSNSQISQMPELIPTDSLAESAAHAMQVANSVLDMVTETTTHLSIADQEKENDDKKEKEKESNAAKSSLNPNASSFTFNPNAKEFSFVPSSFTPAAAPIPVTMVPMSVPMTYPIPPVMPNYLPTMVASPAMYAQQPPPVPTMMMDPPQMQQLPQQQQLYQQQQQPQQALPPQQATPVQGQSQGQSPAQQQQQPQPVMGQSPTMMSMIPPQQQQQQPPQQPQQQMMFDPTNGMTVPMPASMAYMYQQQPGAAGYVYMQQQQAAAYAAYGYTMPNAAGGYAVPAGYYTQPGVVYDPAQMQAYQAQLQQQQQQQQQAAIYSQQYSTYAPQMVGPPGQQVAYDPYAQQQQQGGGYYYDKQMGGRGNNMGRGGGGRGNNGGRYNNNNNAGRSPRTNSYGGGGYNNNYNNNRYNNQGGYNNNSAGQRTPAGGGGGGTESGTDTPTTLAPTLDEGAAGGDGAAASAGEGQSQPPEGASESS